MIVVRPRRLSSLFVPVSFVLLTGAMVAGSAGAQLISLHGIGARIGGLFGLVVSTALFVVVLRSIRSIRIEGDVLTVRGWGVERRLARSACTFGLQVTHASRGGANYVIYVAEGAVRENFGELWSQGAAMRVLARLTAALLPAAAREPAVVQARAVIDALAADHAAARAKVAAFWTSRWRILVLVIGGIVVAYGAGMAILLRRG
jgi:hypothetical protein